MLKNNTSHKLSPAGGDKKIKAKQREQKKKVKMKISGKSVFSLKHIINKKAS